MIQYIQAPTESSSDTLTIERRWNNARQDDIDQRIREVREDPQAYPEYSVSDGRLYHSSVDMGRRSIISLEERDAVFEREYIGMDKPSLAGYVAHMRAKYVNASRRKVTRHYEKYVSNQIHGQAINKRLTRRAMWSSNALSFLALDTIDQTRNPKSRMKHILTIVDVFSRFGWAIAIKNIKSQTTADAFRGVIQQYNLDMFKPHLVMDNGVEFQKDFRSMVRDEYGFSVSNVATYMGVSIVERFNKTVREGLGRAKTRGEPDWVVALPTVVSNYNRTPHSSLGKTPPFVALNGWLQGDDRLIEYIRERTKKVNERNMSREGSRLPPGSRVRISLFAISSAFRKISKQKGKSQDKRKLSEMAHWTVSVFTVSAVSAGTSRAHSEYRLREMAGTFYRNELRLVSNESQLVDDVVSDSFGKDRNMSSLERNAIDNLEILVQANEMGGANSDARRFIGSAIRKEFADEGEQTGRVVAYVSPDEKSSDMELGERWVIEYQNGLQELMTSSELLVSIDSDASQSVREVTEGREESDGEEEEKEDINPEETPPRPLPVVPQTHPLIGRRVRNQQRDRGTVVMWYYARPAGTRMRRYLVKWSSPLTYKGRLTLWKDYNKEQIEAILV
jgi:hypothetical protein